MTRISLIIVLPFLCSLLLDSTTVHGQSKPPEADVKDPRIGSSILITTAGAEFRTPEATVWRGYIGEVFTVTLTNGEWLWIDEKRGWLWEQDCMPFDTAIETMTQRVNQTKSAENYHLRGVAYLSHRNFENAIADFTESLREQPRNAGALNNRGQAHYMMGDLKAAVEDYSAAVAIDAKNALALNNRALAYLRLKDLASALKDLNSALKIVPDYPEALNNRGIVNQELGKPDDAIADFTAALKVYPRYVDALGNRALAHHQKNDHAKAVADLELAIRLDLRAWEAMNDLAWLLATTPVDAVRNRERSLTLARQACEVTEYKQWNTLDTLAAAYAENGEFVEAKQWIGTALEMAPDAEKERLKGHLDLIMAEKPVRE